MSEKRFKKGINLSCVDTETGKTYWYACNLRGLLNELAEENKQLKQRNKFLEEFDGQAKIVANLKEENEQLRKELDNFKPVMFQDMRKGTVILYSKGDINE